VKVYEMAVDKKPDWCLLCPLRGSSIKIDMPQCGTNKTIDCGDGWERSGKVPDDRCVIKELTRKS